MPPTRQTGQQVADGTLTDSDIAAANKDGVSTTPSLRTLGTGALQACAGNDARLSDQRDARSLQGRTLSSTAPGDSAVLLWSSSSSSWLPSTFTAGSVLFATSTGISENNANLFWDAVNARLGIGTATPIAQVDITFTPTANSGNRYAFNVTLTASPTANSSAAYRGFNAGVTLNTADASGVGLNYTTTNFGIDLFISTAGTITSGSSTTTALIGFQAVVAHGDSGGTISTFQGTNYSGRHNSGGTITNFQLVNLTFQSNSTGGTTSARPLRVVVPTIRSGVASIAVTAGGSGYTGATTVTVSGGGGSSCTAVPVISAGVITSITVTHPGSTFTSTPTVTIADSGGGTGATATATIASGTTTSLVGGEFQNQGSAGITSAAGISIAAQSGSTNNCGLLVGTATLPTGSYTQYIQCAASVVGQTMVAAAAQTADFRQFLDSSSNVIGGMDPSAQAYIQTANGAKCATKSISELITLSTSATTTNSTANLLPANSIIKAVCAYVQTAITGATDWSLGDATVASRFASANATLTAGTPTVGLNHHKGSVTTDSAGPTQAAAAKLRITTTGTATAGKIRVTVFYEEFTAPGS
jgi:hypothetical protein